MSVWLGQCGRRVERRYGKRERASVEDFIRKSSSIINPEVSVNAIDKRSDLDLRDA